MISEDSIPDDFHFQIGKKYLINSMMKKPSMILEKKSLVALICRHCQFFKDSDKDLECGAFKILEGLLKKGVITPEEITDVIRK